MILKFIFYEFLINSSTFLNTKNAKNVDSCLVVNVSNEKLTTFHILNFFNRYLIVYIFVTMYVQDI